MAAKREGRLHASRAPAHRAQTQLTEYQYQYMSAALSFVLLVLELRGGFGFEEQLDWTRSSGEQKRKVSVSGFVFACFSIANPRLQFAVCSCIGFDSLFNKPLCVLFDSMLFFVALELFFDSFTAIVFADISLILTNKCKST